MPLVPQPSPYARVLLVSPVFGAFYFVYGAYLPFWSLWLEGIGVSTEQIGLLLGWAWPSVLPAT